MTISAAQWIVLDNLKQGWPYTTNLEIETAANAYLWCIANELIKDGKITDAGTVALIMNRQPKN